MMEENPSCTRLVIKRLLFENRKCKIGVLVKENELVPNMAALVVTAEPDSSLITSETHIEYIVPLHTSRWMRNLIQRPCAGYADVMNQIKEFIYFSKENGILLQGPMGAGKCFLSLYH